MTDHLHHPSVLRNCRIWDFPALIGLIGCLIPILSKDIAKLGMETMGREQLLNLLKQLCASAVTLSGPEEGCGTYRHPFRCHRVSLTIVSACKCAAWRRQLQALLQRQVPERSLTVNGLLIVYAQGRTAWTMQMEHPCRASPSDNPAILTVTDPRLWSKLEVKLRVGDLPFKTQRKWLQMQRIISCQGKQRTSAS